MATALFGIEVRAGFSRLTDVGTNNRAYPRRPPRLGWLFQNVQPFYFVTFNTYRRLPMLARPAIHEAFELFCRRAQERDISVGRYVLMPDHVHLFVALPSQGPTLAQWVQALRSVLGKTLLGAGVAMPHWQDGFFDHVLRNSESYAQKWEYVRMNPIRAGLSKTPEDWPYQGEITRLPFD